MSIPTRIMRDGKDITAEVANFDIRTFAVKDGPTWHDGHHWESTLTLDPPQPIEGVTISASWEGVEYAVWQE